MNKFTAIIYLFLNNMRQSKSSKWAYYLLAKSFYEFCIALGVMHEKLNEFDQALDYFRIACDNQPNIAYGYYELAKTLVKLEKKGEETISCYDRLLELKPDYFQEIYYSFGECLIKTQNYQKAVNIYQRASQIEVMPAHAYNLFQYALIQQDQLDEAITVCFEAIKQIPNYAGSYWNLGNLYLRKKEYEKAITAYKKSLEVNPNYRRNEIQKQLEFLDKILNKVPLLEIWNSLNSTVINKTDQKSWLPIDQQNAYSIFSHESSLRIIKISSMTVNDLKSLSEFGIQVSYLDDLKKYNLSNDLRKPLPFIMSIFEKGYMESICPYTGVKVQSHHSFYTSIQQDNCIDMPIFYYRFVSKQVFYLLVGLHRGDLLAIYFPHEEIYVCIANNAHVFINLNKFKSYFVGSWSNVTDYLLNTKSKDLSIVCGSDSHFGHALLNEMSSYCYLTQCEHSYLENVMQILILPDSFFDLTDFYPSLCSSKIVKYFDNDYSLFDYVLLNNLLTVRVSNSAYFLSQEASKLIYFASVKKNDEIILKRIKEVKASLDLIWFEIRSNDRIWLNQSEGIANIANHLYSDLPNLGIIFAGWSCTDQDKLSDNAMIEKDRQIIKQSQNLINPNIPIFDVVGKNIYEKILWANASILHITTYGSGYMFSSLVSKPLIIHANKGWYPAESMKRQMIQNIPYFKEEIISVVPIDYISEQDSSVHFWKRNYYCNWEGIYQEIINMLNKLKLKESENDKS